MGIEGRGVVIGLDRDTATGALLRGEKKKKGKKISDLLT